MANDATFPCSAHLTVHALCSCKICRTTETTYAHLLRHAPGRQGTAHGGHHTRTRHPLDISTPVSINRRTFRLLYILGGPSGPLSPVVDVITLTAPSTDKASVLQPTDRTVYTSFYILCVPPRVARNPRSPLEPKAAWCATMVSLAGVQ
jgi:hypothetical protein